MNKNERIWERLSEHLPCDFKEFVLETFDSCFDYSIPYHWDHVVSEIIKIMHWRTFHHKGKYKVAQVKSKFGGLRFYLDCEDDQYLYGAIAMAESECMKICTHCGSYKKERIRSGRYNVRCTECATGG
jgi:hypothetical protein